MLPDAIDAVSYTHLDVYKRQAYAHEQFAEDDSSARNPYGGIEVAEDESKVLSLIHIWGTPCRIRPLPDRVQYD